MLLMIDNYDSFTFILVDYFRRLGCIMEVYRNDELTLAEVEEMNPRGIVISPGPKDPDHAGISISLVKQFGGRIPLLGVCLGHQAIGQFYGAKVVRASRLMHGKTSAIYHQGRGVFKDLSSPLKATRYHSLILDPESIPPVLEVTAQTMEGEIMGVKHRYYNVEGVQFHPESILTESGEKILKNFLEGIEECQDNKEKGGKSCNP